jgi:putative membrane protein
MDDKMTKVGAFMFATLLFAASPAGPLVAEETATAPEQAPATGTVVPSQDAVFMMKAADGGRAEVELAKLAMERSTSQPVKEYARRVLDDHAKANEKLREIAGRKKVPLPDQLTGIYQNLLEQLRAEAPANFDQSYMLAQVAEHKLAVALFRDEKTEGIDPALREFAAGQLPVLEAHLEEALTIADGVAHAGRGQDAPR